MSENMRIWDAVSDTDPNHTKHVGQRGGFTAIDAHYQVQRATEQFGPVGYGWWYETEYSETHFHGGEALINCDLTLRWVENIDVKGAFGPVRGCAVLMSSKGYLDPDAPKKAMTDALTKALSHLGFNADVFLGKFDDNKYVEDQRKKYEPTAFASKQAKTKVRNAMLEAAKEADKEALAEATKNLDNDQKAELWGTFNKDQQRMITEVRKGD